MPLYQYAITTNALTAKAVIEADSEEDAKAKLTAMHLPEKHPYVDEDGNPIDHKLVSIELTPIA